MANAASIRWSRGTASITFSYCHQPKWGCSLWRLPSDFLSHQSAATCDMCPKKNHVLSNTTKGTLVLQKKSSRHSFATKEGDTGEGGKHPDDTHLLESKLAPKPHCPLTFRVELSLLASSPFISRLQQEQLHKGGMPCKMKCGAPVQNRRMCGQGVTLQVKALAAQTWFPKFYPEVPI